ncbi:type IV pilus modification protein PilV [Sphaerotilus sp.]|uniref:type IV pilus modification protein PilV n=1 Tax=Sphaerotilus sp. TaxID=2093942 RepID=UPI0034E2240E
MQLKPTMCIRRRPRGRGAGFALVEVLVTVVILAIAALGYAALQLRGLSTNSSAMWRSKATMLAYEAADRVRANVPGATAGQYNNLQNPAVVAACTLTNVCTAAQMAARDFSQWRTNVSNTLPGGSGVICLDSTPDDGTTASPACDGTGSQIAIKVFWSERGTPARFVNVVRP